jgi:homogentisate 1,2-dioxygenase
MQPYGAQYIFKSRYSSLYLCVVVRLRCRRSDSVGRLVTHQLDTNAGNEFESEALPGALPKGKNNPKRCPFGLYAEQISGTAFTVPRRVNQRSWLYRIKPSVVHDPFTLVNINKNLLASAAGCSLTPNQLRWKPLPIPHGPLDFVQGLHTFCCAGSCSAKEGYAIHIYVATESMQERCLANADGDFLVVPQQGALTPPSAA